MRFIHSKHIRARLSRGRTIYATGLAKRIRAGHWLLLFDRKRKVASGVYTLTLRGRHNGRRLVRRQEISIR